MSNHLIKIIHTRCRDVRTALTVGFEGEKKDEITTQCSAQWRSISCSEEFDFEDSQFDLVVFDGSKISMKLVREAHRVLRPNGKLLFSIAGNYTVPDIYRIIGAGFDIPVILKPEWWKFWQHSRVFTIFANKKTWKRHNRLLRDGMMPIKFGNDKK